MKSIYVWILAIVILSLIVWGLFWLSGQGANQNLVKIDLTASDWTFGNKQAKNILIEYSDFQCPACAYFYTIVKQVLEKNNNKLLFAYRHFPLSQHPNAKPAAYAAEAAGQQGKFWEMYALIFERQNLWDTKNNPEEIFTGYAGELKLDLNKFKSDFSSEATKKKVDDDYNSGINVGINATPTFYLNGKKIQPTNYDEFQKIIDGATGNQ